MFTYPIGFNSNQGNPYFATTLYTGSNATQSITTGKNNAAGSLTWIKNRSFTQNHALFDTNRGVNNFLIANATTAQTTLANTLTAFNANGFSIGNDNTINVSTNNYVAWTFLKAAGFFDIVSYTGTGANATISHSVLETVGCIIIKNVDDIIGWPVYHRGIGASQWLSLNSDIFAQVAGKWQSFTPTIDTFRVNGDSDVNAIGKNYIAYLFAHNPLQGIACNSFTTDGSGNATVNVGFKPQWLIFKGTSTTDNWIIVDTTRDWDGNNLILSANTSNAEAVSVAGGTPTVNGFNISAAAFSTYIYIAIR